VETPSDNQYYSQIGMCGTPEQKIIINKHVSVSVFVVVVNIQPQGGSKRLFEPFILKSDIARSLL